MLKHKIVWVEEIKRFLKQNRNVEILHLIPHAWEEVSGQMYNVQYLIIYREKPDYQYHPDSQPY